MRTRHCGLPWPEVLPEFIGGGGPDAGHLFTSLYPFGFSKRRLGYQYYGVRKWRLDIDMTGDEMASVNASVEFEANQGHFFLDTSVPFEYNFSFPDTEKDLIKPRCTAYITGGGDTPQLNIPKVLTVPAIDRLGTPTELEVAVIIHCPSYFFDLAPVVNRAYVRTETEGVITWNPIIVLEITGVSSLSVTSIESEELGPADVQWSFDGATAVPMFKVLSDSNTTGTISITPSEYWEYRRSDGLFPIYDQTTGAVLSDPHVNPPNDR